MRALFIGRFQPFHNGHLEVIREIAREFIPIVVIGSAEVSHTINDPFTAGERYLMISESLKSEGITEFAIIPIMDVNRYGIWVSHITTLVPTFDVVIANNPLTRRLFSEQGFEVRSPKRYSREVFRGTYIRELMLSGGEWEPLVPAAVSSVINDLQGVARMRELGRSDGPGGDD
jgi:nicotinamide-nucleotide adenylyltransferase